MKNEIKQFIVIIVLFFPLCCCGQASIGEESYKHNELQLSTAASWIFEPNQPGIHRSPLNMPMISYKRAFFKSWFASVSLSEWMILSPQSGSNKEIVYNTPLTTQEAVGRLGERLHYKYIELATGYNVFKQLKHNVSIALGVSYTWGDSYYYDEVQIMPWGDYYVGHMEKNHFWGAVTKLAYDYKGIWKQRISVGAFITGRYYPGLKGGQMDMGFQVGYNF